MLPCRTLYCGEECHRFHAIPLPNCVVGITLIYRGDVTIEPIQCSTWHLQNLLKESQTLNFFDTNQLTTYFTCLLRPVMLRDSDCQNQIIKKLNDRIVY